MLDEVWGASDRRRHLAS